LALAIANWKDDGLLPVGRLSVVMLAVVQHLVVNSDLKA
jgi:hypothetical protein